MVKPQWYQVVRTIQYSTLMWYPWCGPYGTVHLCGTRGADHTVQYTYVVPVVQTTLYSISMWYPWCGPYGTVDLCGVRGADHTVQLTYM